jgi:hypothetical protein
MWRAPLPQLWVGLARTESTIGISLTKKSPMGREGNFGMAMMCPLHVLDVLCSAACMLNS